jgi:hypothetical protein
MTTLVSSVSDTHYLLMKLRVVVYDSSMIIIQAIDLTRVELNLGWATVFSCTYLTRLASDQRQSSFGLFVKREDL